MVPVVFHNWKGYDAHHIVKEGVATRPHWNLSVVATATESYLNMRAQFSSPLTAAAAPTKEKRSEEYCWLNFIDSFQFLFASLAKLVSLCPTMPLTQSLPYPESVKSGKGVFPYSFLDAEEKLLSTSLPPQEAFFDTLSRTPLSNEDYARAQEAWEGMRCTIFQDYMEGKIGGYHLIFLHTYIYHVLLQDTLNWMCSSWRTCSSPFARWRWSKMDWIR